MIRLVPYWATQYEAFWDAIRKRNMWFIKLRYGAVLMLTTLILASEFFLGFKFTQTQTFATSIITLSILVYNILLHVGKKHIKSIAGQFNPLHLSLIQMLLDFIGLFLLVHFTGGIETPLYMLFVFHMIIGSLVLPGSIIYTVGTIVVLVFGGIVFSEYYHIIPHYTIQGFLNTPLYDDFNYVVSILTIFGFTMFISVYLANGIARQLYRMEQDLVESIDKLNTVEIEKQKYIIGIVHEIKIEEVINELSNKHSANAEGKKIELIFNDDRKAFTKIIGDKFLLTLAISNLIGNAIKYVDEDGLIEVKVEDGEEDVVITVCDNGIGIPENEHEKIFKEFFRSSNIKKDEHEGTGIGLSIVKEIIEKHEGKISVESPSRLASQNRPGTCFKIQLPKINISLTKNGGIQ